MAVSVTCSRRSAARIAIAVVLASCFAVATCDAAPGGSEGRSSEGGLADLLGGPLPGTVARADSDLAGRLERGLAGFDGIDRANVVLTRAADASDASPHVAVQLHLVEGFSPTAAWLRTLQVFTSRAVPHLDPSALTIVDSSGRTLYDAGEYVLPPTQPAMLEPSMADETFRLEPWWLWMAAAAGFLLVVAGTLLSRLFRPETNEDTTEEPSGPFDFLTDLPGERVVRELEGERPAVIAAVMALAPEDVAVRLRERAEIADRLPKLRERPDPAMAEALAKVLRGRFRE